MEPSSPTPRPSFFRLLASLLPIRTPKPRTARYDIPETSPERLQRAKAETKAFDVEYVLSRTQEWAEKSDTILYLAYGSNLCHETFQGTRGIRPISQVNVVVPELRLTFDLPGLPYAEPCFANTARRDPSQQQEDHGRGSEEDCLLLSSPDYHKNRWKKGLVGVVYEVTPADYAHIITTEGGGSSYRDIVVTCHPLMSSDTVPRDPTSPPFKAHTLFFSEKPDPPSTNTCLKGPRRLRRPDPSYAQPSARYLKLITDGAAEHSLPLDYRAYLQDIRPYTITTRRQRLGQFVFVSSFLPLILFMFALQRICRDKQGRSPRWVASLSSAIQRGIWFNYDVFFKHVFGDGERTIYREDDAEALAIQTSAGAKADSNSS